MILRSLIIVLVFIINLHSEETSELGSVNITTSKLTDSQINTSSSLDLIKEDKLKEFKINSIEDLSSIVSNTNISGIGSKNEKTFTFRGVSNYLAYESSVAMYIDDIPIPMSYGYGAVNMNDISFIEVLKGPQGTLFGKNAQSGVINIYTKPVASKLESELSVDISEYDSQNLYTRVSSPTMIDDLSFAISFTSDKSDGYTKNTLTGNNVDKRDLKSFNSKLKYELNNNTEINFNYIKTLINDGGSPFKVNTKDDPFNIDNESEDEYLEMDTDMASLSLITKGENYKFTSISALSKQEIRKKDYVALFGGLTINKDIDIKEVSQEFRLNYYTEKLDFLLGAFYSDKLKFDYDEDQKLVLLNLTSINEIENTDKNLAFFFQSKYWIEDNLSFLIGARYQQFIRDFSKDLKLFSNTSYTGEDITTWNYFTPTISLEYSPSKKHNLYFTYSEGYRPGGYNYREETNVLDPYKEETTDSYELGYKYDSNSYFFHGSLFYNDIKNQRLNTLDDNLSSTIYNADKSYSFGLETKIGYRSDYLDLYSTFGFIKAKIKELDSNTFYEGKNIIEVPQKTASLSLKYKFDENFYLQTNLKYMGKRYYNLSNSESLSSYTVTDLELGYTKKGSKLSFYVNNIFDKEYNDFMISTPSNNYYHFGKPRVFGAKLSYKF